MNENDVESLNSLSTQDNNESNFQAVGGEIIELGEASGMLAL